MLSFSSMNGTQENYFFLLYCTIIVQSMQQRWRGCSSSRGRSEESLFLCCVPFVSTFSSSFLFSIFYMHMYIAYMYMQWRFKMQYSKKNWGCCWYCWKACSWNKIGQTLYNTQTHKISPFFFVLYSDRIFMKLWIYGFSVWIAFLFIF